MVANKENKQQQQLAQVILHEVPILPDLRPAVTLRWMLTALDHVRCCSVIIYWRAVPVVADVDD